MYPKTISGSVAAKEVGDRSSQVYDAMATLSRHLGDQADLRASLGVRLGQVLRPVSDSPVETNTIARPILVPLADTIRGAASEVEATNDFIRGLLDRLEI